MKKYYKFEINLMQATIFSLILFILPLCFCLNIIYPVLEYNLVVLFISVILWLCLHELLHGLAYFLTGTKLQNITFGVALEKGILYCLTKQEVKKSSVLISLLTPFVVIGIVTLIVSIIFNMPLLCLLSILNISGASADVLMFIYFLTIKNDLKYTELDDPTTFAVITTDNLEEKKRIGVKLIEKGEYPSDKIAIKDHRHLVISKASYIFIILLLLIMIISLFIQ